MDYQYISSHFEKISDLKKSNSFTLIPLALIFSILAVGSAVKMSCLSILFSICPALREIYPLPPGLTIEIKSFTIEKQLGENWRKAGDILAHYLSDNGDCYLQAVINNDLTVGTVLRLAEQPNTQLTVMALPYSKD